MECMMIEKNPSPIIAQRIMLVIATHEKLDYNIEGFLSVCDAAFKNAQIEKSVISLNRNQMADDKNFDNYLEKSLKKPVMQFKPDAIIFLDIENIRNNRVSCYVKYYTFLMPTAKLFESGFSGFSLDASEKPKFITSITLFSNGSKEKDKKDGIKQGQNFLLALEKYVSNIKY
jgi:hypothetical protein